MLTKTANELIGKKARILESGKVGTIDTIVLDGFSGTASVIIPVTMMKDVPLDAIQYCTCGEGEGCSLCAESPEVAEIIPKPNTFIEAAKHLQFHLQSFTDTVVRLEREQVITIILQQRDGHRREAELLTGAAMHESWVRAQECEALAASIRTAGTWANLL